MFPGRAEDKHITYDSVYQYWQDKFLELGLDHRGFSCHSTRRWFITELVGSGTHPKVIQKITGHKNLNIVMDYYSDDVISELRETFLAKEQLAKIRCGLIAHIRQRLSYEFSELAKKTFNISKVRGFTPAIGWLAGIYGHWRYDRPWKTSVSHTLNITLSKYTRSHAQTLMDIEERITEHYQQLAVILTDTRFDPYHRVFDQFGFGTDSRTLLLFHIYPMNKFLINGQRWVEYEESKGKLQKRDRSLRKFQAFIGMTYKIKFSLLTSICSFIKVCILRL